MRVRAALGILLWGCWSLGGLRAAVPQGPAWARQEPIYEVNLEMFSQAGNFEGLRQRLPQLKALGVGMLWIMPIYTRGLLRAFNSPYCVRDYRGIHAPYGKAEDFRALVAAAHAQGLHILLDWVPNHSSFDHPWIKQHPDFYKRNAKGEVAGVNGFIDIAQLDYGNKALWPEMIKAMAFWVKNFDVDGFRCDMAWNIPAGFWQQARAELFKIKPLFLLAEASDAKLQKAFDSDYDWTFSSLDPHADFLELARGHKSARVVDEDLAKEKDYAAPPVFARMRYTCNHDEWNNVGTPFQLLGNAAEALAVLAATLPGKPMIYNGQEIGWDHPNIQPKTGWNRPPDAAIDWTPSTRTAWYTKFYGGLFHAYRQQAALYQGGFHKLASNQDEAVYAFIRQSGNSKALVALNLSAKPAEFEIEDALLKGSYTELFSGEALQAGTSWKANLQPWKYKVFVSRSE